MTAQTIFYAAFVLTVISFVCFYAFFSPKPNLEKFKRAGSRKAAAEILHEWGEHGLTLARRNLAFDWFFILIYSTMWISGAIYLGPRVDAKLHVPAMLFAAIGLAGALCDVIENLCLRKMLYGNDSESAPRLCARVMRMNIALFAIAAVYFVVASITSATSTTTSPGTRHAMARWEARAGRG
jgi:hypothetical protein